MHDAEILAACRVPDSIPSGDFGLWTIRRCECPAEARAFVGYCRNESGRYTVLERHHEANMQLERGEIVMEDTPRELRRHLPIILAARGRVLVTGLGLGCVVRGLLTRPEVEHIDVVEIDPNIMRWVGPSLLGESRVSLHLGDAESIEWPEGRRWDFAWHDVWSLDESLDLVHARLLSRYDRSCARQGAWQLPRMVKRIWPRSLIGGGRRKVA